MSKKKLNLHILELEKIDNKQTAVSLMPCPCGTSGGGGVACGGCHGTWSSDSQQIAENVGTGLLTGLGTLIGGLWGGITGAVIGQSLDNLGDGQGSAAGDASGDLGALGDSPGPGII